MLHGGNGKNRAFEMIDRMRIKVIYECNMCLLRTSLRVFCEDHDKYEGNK